MGFIQAWDVKGFNHLSLETKKSLGGSSDPYFLAFVRGLAAVVDTVGEDDRISIICDDDPHTAWDCYNHYRSLGEAHWPVQKKAVAISFANDKHFPALQAADMLAFLVRHEASEKFYGKANMWRRLFDRVITEPQPPYGIMRWFKMFADEQKLVDFANEARATAARVIAQKEAERQKRMGV